jgi:hypothetical protein
MPAYTSIFDQEWWYDAATDGKWQQVEYRDQDIAAKLVFSTYSSRGSTTIGMPTLARTMEPIISIVGPCDNIIARRAEIITRLEKLLPKFAQFKYTLSPESELDISYHLAGYQVDATYTFRTDPSGEHDPWTAMERKLRHKIKNGSRRVAVEVHDDVGRYVKLSSKFIANRAFTDRMNYDAVTRIWAACHARKRSSVLSCVDGTGCDLASAILIWDDRHVYYWLSCRDPEANDTAANSILIWNAIEFAQKAALIFDMDGYSRPEAGLFLSRFGLSPHRRYDVSMTNSAAEFRAAVSSRVGEIVGPTLRARLLTAKNALRAAYSLKGGGANNPPT